MDKATKVNCVMSSWREPFKVTSDAVDDGMVRKISHNRPVMTVKRDSTVVAKKVKAVIALRMV